MKTRKNASKLRFSIFSIFMFFYCVGNLNAQFSLNEGKVSVGKGAMTSGFDVVISFSNPNKVALIAQGNNERINVRIGKSWGDEKKFGNFTILATGGVFKNVPWIGPMFLYSHKWFDLCSWSGIGMSTDNQLTDPGWNPNFFFNYQEAGLNFGKNRFAYSFMFFRTAKINHFLIYKRNFNLGKDTGLFVETTYDFTQEIPMFVVGFTHSFAKK